MEQEESPVPRIAARVLLIDETDRILLVRFVDPDRALSWWATPGGGLEPGETHEEAARREIYEETGLARLDLGPCVWTRAHTFRFGGTLYHQHERYYLAHVQAFTPHTVSLSPGEARVFRDMQWWTLDALETTDMMTSPRDLATLFRTLLDQGPPEEPLHLDATR